MVRINKLEVDLNTVKVDGQPHLLAAAERMGVDYSGRDTSHKEQFHMAMFAALAEHATHLELYAHDPFSDHPTFTAACGSSGSIELDWPNPLDPSAKVICRKTGQPIATPSVIQQLCNWLWIELNRQADTEVWRQAYQK